jgi:tetratricopeptide (TPR) repeat protein
MEEKDRPTWRRQFPLAPLWRRADYEILKDVDEALGLVLWRAVRQVREWVDSTPVQLANRQRELSPEVRARHAFATFQAPEIAGALRTFATLSTTPRLVDGAQLVTACSAVAEWAEGYALGEMALQFAEAAAAVDPRSPKLANRAGRACRRAGEFERSAEWYERAAALASTRAHPTDRTNTDEYIRAHLGAGALYYAQGRHSEAAPHINKGAERARSRNRRAVAGEASHDLMALADAIGTFEEVVHHGRASLESYPIRHPRVPMLGLDFAFALVRNNHPELALDLLSHVGPLITQPSIQVPYWGTLARAAGLVADRARFHEAARNVAELVSLYGEWGAGACVNVAEGARALEEWDIAERYAATALDLARRWQDGMVARDATELLDRISVRDRGQKTQPSGDHGAERLVSELIRRLKRWRERQKPERPSQPPPPAE